jgi:pimeloyl-ACP methyl ester carboxylesterase
MILISPAIFGDYNYKTIQKIPIISQLLMTYYWYPKSVKSQKKEFFNKMAFEEYAARLNYFKKTKGYKRVYNSTWKYMLTSSMENVLREIIEKRNDKKCTVIIGKFDPYCDLNYQNKFFDIWEGAKVIEIDSAGHMPNYERAEMVNPVIEHILYYY